VQRLYGDPKPRWAITSLRPRDFVLQYKAVDPLIPKGIAFFPPPAASPFPFRSTSRAGWRGRPPPPQSQHLLAIVDSRARYGALIENTYFFNSSYEGPSVFFLRVIPFIVMSPAFGGRSPLAFSPAQRAFSPTCPSLGPNDSSPFFVSLPFVCGTPSFPTS